MFGGQPQQQQQQQQQYYTIGTRNQMPASNYGQNYAFLNTGRSPFDGYAQQNYSNFSGQGFANMGQQPASFANQFSSPYGYNWY
ncbi:unnamed protein product [Adineta steineri]|uniref:Uncharacterized protein n=1 Tax=Adineta steineri TaxID=433720 RepID=A0A815SC71_9BILA|nr:unnamed protein product [Adineta steineri]CAF0981866.1 unnamed protein product [Adineta steineri]CAF1487814.1 unnamed protein product [Adineta steineri]CAF3494237.1 unnamed protein product [Adineta steineri]CAF3976931.1 unnamed protein product [Adineta steineri]